MREGKYCATATASATACTTSKQKPFFCAMKKYTLDLTQNNIEVMPASYQASVV